MMHHKKYLRLQSNVKDKTCFNNRINPTCIDLIIKNGSKFFQEYEVNETGPSDFHKMSLTVMKVFYNKQSIKRFF